MDTIRIDYNIGPKEDDSEVVGSMTFEANNVDEAFIINAIKKSIKKLNIEREKVIVGLMDIFVNNTKKYEVGFFGTNKLIKTDVRKC